MSALHRLRTHVLRMPQMQELTAGPGQVELTVGIYWHCDPEVKSTVSE